MNGVHDMGGLECFGPINPDPDEPMFHAEWERRVLAMTVCMGATGEWNLDQGRFARESLPPIDYLSIGYYRIWLTALEHLLVQRNLVSRQEMRDGNSLRDSVELKRVLKASDIDKVLRAGAPVDRPATQSAQFCVGDSVRVENQHKTGHTRLPGYIKGHIGIVHKVHGCHVFPDANAQGTGENPQWLYNVQFKAQELWGESRKQAAHIHVDCWESYLSAGLRS